MRKFLLHINPQMMANPELGFNAGEIRQFFRDGRLFCFRQSVALKQGAQVFCFGEIEGLSDKSIPIRFAFRMMIVICCRHRDQIHGRRFCRIGFKERAAQKHDAADGQPQRIRFDRPRAHQLRR